MTRAGTPSTGVLADCAIPHDEKAVDVSREMTEPHSKNGEAHINDQSGDDILLVEVGRGSIDALALLFRRHRQTVVNVARRILRDSGEAEDLCQEVFVYLFQKASLFDPQKGSAPSWIFQIAYHRAFTRRQYLALREHRRNEELPDRDIADNREQLLLDGIVAKELLEHLRTSISKNQLATLELFFFEGYTLREIAAKSGETLGCIRNRYYRGLDKLRTVIFPTRSA